jgi:hypothetical protein
VGWVLAPFWMYVVFASTAVGICWTVWVLVRGSSYDWAAAGAAARQRPPSVPSADQYRELVPIAPASFEDELLVETAAASVFNAWVRQLPMAPRDPSLLIRSVHLETRHIGRLTSTIDKRTPAWREATLPDRSAVTRSTVTIETIDPWAATPDQVRASSRCVASCGHCVGQGSVACPACNGSTRAKCSVCDGTGKAYGYAVNGSRRLMNCKSCRTKGEVDCEACTSGKATCSPCQGAGTVTRWIEIVETSRTNVDLERDPEAERTFGWNLSDKQTPAHIERDAQIESEVSSEGPLSRENLAHHVPQGWIEAKWRTIQPKIGTDERIRSQTFHVLEIPAVDVSYTMGDEEAETVRFEGRRMLAPPLGPSASGSPHMGVGSGSFATYW